MFSFHLFESDETTVSAFGSLDVGELYSLLTEACDRFEHEARETGFIASEFSLENLASWIESMICNSTMSSKKIIKDFIQVARTERGLELWEFRKLIVKYRKLVEVFLHKRRMKPLN